VTIQLPETGLIDPDVTAGKDCTLETRRAAFLAKTKLASAAPFKTAAFCLTRFLDDDVTVKPHS